MLHWSFPEYMYIHVLGDFLKKFIVIEISAWYTDVLIRQQSIVDFYFLTVVANIC